MSERQASKQRTAFEAGKFLTFKLGEESYGLRVR